MWGEIMHGDVDRYGGDGVGMVPYMRDGVEMGANWWGGDGDRMLSPYSSLIWSQCVKWLTSHCTWWLVTGQFVDDTAPPDSDVFTWVNEWMSEWMDEWMNEWMNEWVTLSQTNCCRGTEQEYRSPVSVISVNGSSLLQSFKWCLQQYCFEVVP